MTDEELAATIELYDMTKIERDLEPIETLDYAAMMAEVDSRVGRS